MAHHQPRFHHLVSFLFLLLTTTTTTTIAEAPSPAVDTTTNTSKPKCEQCIPHYTNLESSTQCEMNQQWGSNSNYLCGPNSGLGCELAQYPNSSFVPLEVTFESANATAIKPECALEYMIPTPTAAVSATTSTGGEGGDGGSASSTTSWVLTMGTGRNCTGDLDIYVRVVSPCYQHHLFEYGFDSHSILVPCTNDGEVYCNIENCVTDKYGGVNCKVTDEMEKCSANPKNRMLQVDIALDVYKYGEIAGAHARGVINLYSAKCTHISGVEGLVVVSEGVGRGRERKRGGVVPVLLFSFFVGVLLL